MLRYYGQKSGDEISRTRIADYLRMSRDRVLDSGLTHFWFKKWVIAAVVAIGLIIFGIVLLVRSTIDFDTFLNYFALGLLMFVLVTLFYGIIAIHDVPYEIAKHRNHPHQDAIHAAGWVSLFTLHAIWPFLWIWAMLYRPERGWGLKDGSASENTGSADEIAELRRRVAELEERIKQGAH